MRPRLKRRKWEEIAEFVGSPGTVKYAGKDIPCIIKEVIISEGRNGRPELSIVTEEGKRYPLKRFTPISTKKSQPTEEPAPWTQRLVEKKAQEQLVAGKGTLINRSDNGICLYEVRLSPATSVRSVLFNERTQKVIKVL